MDDSNDVSFAGVVVILVVIISCLMMIQMVLLSYLAKAQLSVAVVAITEYVDNECTGE